MKKQKGVLLLEAVVSIFILGIISTVLLSTILNSYKHFEISKTKSDMTVIAKNYIELIKSNELDVLYEEYDDLKINENGYEVQVSLENKEEIKNCTKINVQVISKDNVISISTYKVN